MRTYALSGTTAAVAGVALLFAPVAQAHTAPGDNGTVKIHDAATGAELHKNEPHVCTFYLDAFGFDSAQQVTWHIEAWAPTAGTKGETVKSGTLTLDGSGHGRTADLGLPDGHYKLFWNFDGEHGKAKQKVFWTDCKGEGGGGKPTGTPSATPVPSTTATSSPTSSAPAGASAAPSPSGQGDSGDLAETGSGAPVGALAGAAVALLALGGGFLMFRRRRTGQH
ncbi:LAETG motif-containing sortase-dependent surface protein [Streptomyces odontomachi]|uniref:LAETG motif-containing sortase-dependent surface protein n=1 Tax=Streptomyces odontomachi TaxID=2944940 RepID=UPI00210B183D|nr:LAETG motif-containing sortase-dependent surface protein [Streptomyces sp. ODS25]